MRANAFIAWCAIALGAAFVGHAARAVALSPNGASEPAPPEPGSYVFNARGGLQDSEDKARDDALDEAQKRIRIHLLSQDPPIRRFPSLETIRTEMVRRWGVIAEERIKDPDSPLRGTVWYRTSVEIELKPEHIRELRGEQRSLTAAWWVGGLAAVAAVVAMFFRFDESTKGYVTGWLATLAALAIGVLGALWWFGA